MDSNEKPFILILWFKIMFVQSFQKVVNKNDSSRLSKWCFSVTTGSIFLIRVTISNFAQLAESDLIQFPVSGFFTSRQSQKSKVSFIDLCRYSFSYFSITTGLISSIKIPFKNLDSLQSFLMRHEIFLILASEFWLSAESNCANSFGSPLFSNLLFVNNYRIHFSVTLRFEKS